MLTDQQRQFLEIARVAHLATADADGLPHVVPVCHTVIGDKVFFTIDEKPKREGGLKRVSNIKANPKAALVVDHYDEDWSKLGWVMIQGPALLLKDGDEHGVAQVALRERYPQLLGMRIDHLPVVAIEIDHVMSWGRLEPSL